MEKEMRTYVVERKIAGYWKRPIPVDAVSESAAVHARSRMDERAVGLSGSWRDGVDFFYRSRQLGTGLDGWKVFCVTAEYRPEFTIEEQEEPDA